MFHDNNSLPDYKDDAKAYEIEERSRPDEMLMLQIAIEQAISVLGNLSNASVLDLCCGTGLSMEKLVDHPNVDYIVGVDISQNYIEFACNKYSNCSKNPVFIVGDAISTPLPNNKWDLIMLASAYHHIEDHRKLDFLKRISYLLGENGVAIFAENILPEYDIGNKESYNMAVKIFYEDVLHTVKYNNQNISSYVIKLIERVIKYGIDGEYEYKVCKSIFMNHLELAGLKVVKEIKVWPESGLLKNTTGGNYFFKVINAV